MLTFVLYVLAFVIGAFILTVVCVLVCAIIGAYLTFRYDSLDYVKANNIDDTNNTSNINDTNNISGIST